MRAAGVDADRWEYGQTAIITNVVAERFHDYTAYERFTPTGPMAMLPIGDGRCVVVWTLEPEIATQVLAYDDERFLEITSRRLRVERSLKSVAGVSQASVNLATETAELLPAAGASYPQATQGALADMAVQVDAAALLVQRAAYLLDQGQRASRESSMAKLYATEAAGQVVDRALQLHGGAGLVAGSVTEHLYREVRALRIYEGASEVQRLIIARDLLREGATHG